MLLEAEQLEFPVPTVYVTHCCFCSHVERSYSPQEGHEFMEGHYMLEHQALIERLLAHGR